MNYILSIDQGTTSSRAIVFDINGDTVTSSQREFTQHFPNPGWVEHDAIEIWISQKSVIDEVFEKLKTKNINPANIKVAGITNQRETTVLWNRKTGKPIHNAIVWQDRRTAEYCNELRAQGLGEMIRKKTGLEIDAYFSATKIKWLLDNVNGARALAELGELAFGTIDSWLLWRLTDGRVHATDVSNASRTLIWNINTRKWDEDLLKLFNIPAEILPQVRPSSYIFGSFYESGREIPIGGIAGDQQASAFGQGCFNNSIAKNTYGTGCFLLSPIGQNPFISQKKLITTVAWQLENQPTEYALEGSAFMAGAIVQWLRDGLQIINHTDEIEKLATSVSDNGGVTLIPAFTGLGAPYWQPEVRAMISGLTRGSTKAHIARATLEAIAHQVSDLLEIIHVDRGADFKELRVDGGASKNNFLMQLQADISGFAILRSKVSETTAFGVAGMAGLAVGIWKTQNDFAQVWQLDKKFVPQISNQQRNLMREQWKNEIARCCFMS